MPEIVKAKWFKKFGLSFLPEEIRAEKPIPELLDALSSSLDDPFGKPQAGSDALLEKEIQQEIAEKRREQAESKGIAALDLDGFFQGRPVRKKSRSVDEIRLESPERLALKTNSTPLQEEPKSSELKELKIIYKNNVTLFSPSPNIPEDSLMSQIKSIALKPQESRSAHSRTSSRAGKPGIVDEIDEGYSHFESEQPKPADSAPVDVASQTLPQLIVAYPQDPRSSRIVEILRGIEDESIIEQMLLSQRDKKEMYTLRMLELENSLRTAEYELKGLDPLTRRIDEDNLALERSIDSEAKQFSSAIETKTAQRDKLKDRVEVLKAQTRL